MELQKLMSSRFVAGRILVSRNSLLPANVEHSFLTIPFCLQPNAELMFTLQVTADFRACFPDLILLCFEGSEIVLPNGTTHSQWPLLNSFLLSQAELIYFLPVSYAEYFFHLNNFRLTF
jgi:hypothetical protein